MIQLRPSEPHTIVRILQDTQDNDTSYVQAKVRRASDGVVLDTINLNDLGNRVFTKVWQAPGQLQLQIIITTTVYTDSSYSSINTNYFSDSNHYIIENRPGYWPQFGTGGGSIDYKKIRQIIREVIDETPTKDFPEIPKTDLSGVILQLGRIEGILPKILKAFDEIPEPDKVNFQPVLKQLQDLKHIIQNKPDPELDLTPILEAIHRHGELSTEDSNDLRSMIVEEMNRHMQSRTQHTGDVKETLRKAVDTMMKEVMNRLQEIEQAVDAKSFTFSIPPTIRDTKPKEAKQPRFTL